MVKITAGAGGRLRGSFKSWQLVNVNFRSNSNFSLVLISAIKTHISFHLQTQLIFNYVVLWSIFEVHIFFLLIFLSSD